MNENENQNKDLHFKGQYKNEHVVTFFRHHWITLLPELVLSILILATLIFLIILLAPLATNADYKTLFQVGLFIVVPLMTYFIHMLFLEFIKHFMQTIIITDCRIVEVKKTIFIKDSEDTLFLENIQDVRKQQNGFWKNIFGFGDLIIVMASSDIKTISFVPNPNYHFRLVSRITQEYNQKYHPENPMVVNKDPKNFMDEDAK